ncbi:hypothetical protein ABW21_db0206890 [Orbilia brochopaga]|nr:hypothetical protein ABW21_db0206890 [Drechslerella brochopaga]
MKTAWARAGGQQRSSGAKSWSLPFYDTADIAGRFIRSWAELQCDFLNQIGHSPRRKLRPVSFATNLSFMAGLFFLTLCAQRCRADIVDVLVGLRNGDSELVFTPEVIYQDVGEQVRFQFYPQNHSVAQSSLNSPCAPLGGASSGAGFFSGFNSVDDIQGPNPTFMINITSSEPVYFYCAQGRHCQGGMVGIINPPNANAINDFKAAASKVPFAEIPLVPPSPSQSPSQTLPSPKFPTTTFVGLAQPTTRGTDPQYTPNTPAPKTTSPGGLSTSGYIAAGVSSCGGVGGENEGNGWHRKTTGSGEGSEGKKPHRGWYSLIYELYQQQALVSKCHTSRSSTINSINAPIQSHVNAIPTYQFEDIVPGTFKIALSVSTCAQ